MKKFASLYIFFFWGFLLNAQTVADYIVYYNFTFITDTINNIFTSPEEFMLIRIGSESRFMAKARYYNDSTLAVFSANYPEPEFKSQEEMQSYVNLMMERVSKKPVRSDYKIIKNFKTGNFICIGMHSLLPIQYLEESMMLHWEITQETDNILGLECIKSITKYGGRRYYAWFAPTVPINDGPYVFQGLPGLILKVTDDQGWYTFTVKDIVFKKTKVVTSQWINENSQKIDRKTFVARMAEYKKNPGMPTGILNFPEEVRLEMKKEFEKRFDLLIEQY